MPSNLRILDLGTQKYLAALRTQEELVAKRRAGEAPDTLILVEHEPVYTLGRAAKESNVLAPHSLLREKGIEVARTGRGGDVTFHGPGQLVVYPVIALPGREKGAVWYVTSLEEVLIRTLAGFGLKGERDAANRGVWIGNSKIAAIGVRISRGITMHGFALNVTTDLEYYRWIIPCGIPDKGITSMHLLTVDVDMTSVKAGVVRNFREVFGYEE